MNEFKRFFQTESGVAATEYAIMLSLIVVVSLAAITTLGQRVEGAFSTVARSLSVN